MENYTLWNDNFSQVLSELDGTGGVEGAGGGRQRRSGARALLGCALLLLIVSTLLGNTLVCAAVVKFRHLRSKVTNLFVVSLAVSDLCVAALVMPWEAVSQVTGSWLFGRDFCGVWIAFDIMCSTASILNLCIISVDRYWAIASPFKYERKMTHRAALVMIGVAWTLSILISFIPVHLNWHVAEEEVGVVAVAVEEEEEEEERWAPGVHAAPTVGETDGNVTASCVANLNKTYAISSSLVSFYIPVVIMFATYTRIYRIAQTQIRRITSLERAAGQAQGDSRLAHETSLKKTSFRKETKVLKTLSVIVGVFVCCWLPFFVLNCAMPFCDPPCVSDATFAVFVWFGWANSSLNPVIYAFNADFRRAFAAILGCSNKIRSGNAVEAVNISNELVSYHHDTTLQKDAQVQLLGAQHHPHTISIPGEEDEVSLISNASCSRRRKNRSLPVQFECDGEISLDTITPFTSAGPLECDQIPGRIDE